MQTPFFNIDEDILEISNKAQDLCANIFLGIEETKEYNQQKVLKAFIENRVSEMHLKGTTGYGYGDVGRDTLDKVYATVFGCEDALVRHNFVSGTHAIAVALFGVLRPNDTMLCVTGRPYDTLIDVIGLNGSNDNGSLIDFGIKYEEISLTENGEIDFNAIKTQAVEKKVIYIQRSRGYVLRPSLCIKDIEEIVKIVRGVNKDAIIMVDNCYGEFVETLESTQVGADIIIGSLIKNPGGGVATTGGYIAGKSEHIEKCACRLSTPATGKEVGCSLNELRNMYMGLFLAPVVTGEALKTAVFAAAFFELLGYDVYPRYDVKRADIIEAIILKSPNALKEFCKGIQEGSPIDSFVVPEPWEMPGYTEEVIMAAGTFTMGASIELSADGPMREPYVAYMQGGITYYSGKLGLMLAAQSIKDGKANI